MTVRRDSDSDSSSHGKEPMRVAVITALFQPRADWLKRCCNSVRDQIHACTHILVSDGDGPCPIQDFAGQFIQLGHNHNDWGNTPRSIGGLSAAAQGFDAMLWLDQDNWLYPHHVSSLVALHRQTQHPVCTSSRDLYHLNGQRLGPCQHTDGVRFVDANCFLLTRPAYGLIAVWSLMPSAWHVCSDVFFFAMIKKQGIQTAHFPHPTMGYTATRDHLYHSFGVAPPPGVKNTEAINQKINDFLRLQKLEGPPKVSGPTLV